MDDGHEGGVMRPVPEALGDLERSDLQAGRHDGGRVCIVWQGWWLQLTLGRAAMG
jgi:hypothetical protein